MKSIEDEIERRREYSSQVLNSLRKNLKDAFSEAIPKTEISDKLCIFATGSFGRLEASEGSDLDAFIVGGPSASNDLNEQLHPLDEKIIVGRIVECIRSASLPDPDRDGEFLRCISFPHLIGNVGLPEDEIKNTLTPRLLLLLESQPIVNRQVYDDVLASVIDLYWRDYEDFSNNFRPTFLINDILKYWRILCVDYESKMTDYLGGPAEAIEARKFRRRVKNLKLRYLRMMTCFSIICVLCAEYSRENTVTRERALELVKMTPVERLLWISNLEKDQLSDVVSRIIEGYANFLRFKSMGPSKVEEALKKQDKMLETREDAKLFGDNFYELICLLDKKNSLFRFLVI